MEYVASLIDRAAKVCGGYTALANRMGIPVQNISLMKAGKRTISPATAAELADIAGEDAREAVIDAVIESAKGTRREGALRAILGKGLAAGVTVMLAFSYNGDSIAAMDSVAKTSDSLYIVSTKIGRKLRALIGAVCSHARILSRSWLAPGTWGTA